MAGRIVLNFTRLIGIEIARPNLRYDQGLGTWFFGPVHLEGVVPLFDSQGRQVGQAKSYKESDYWRPEMERGKLGLGDWAFAALKLSHPAADEGWTLLTDRIYQAVGSAIEPPVGINPVTADEIPGLAETRGIELSPSEREVLARLGRRPVTPAGGRITKLWLATADSGLHDVTPPIIGDLDGLAIKIREHKDLRLRQTLKECLEA